MNGFLIVDKPNGITSHDVVNKLRKVLGTKKIGHTGTLDPIATGVLVLCIGDCTKASNYLISDNKTYDVKLKFGIKTDTGDITGKVLEEKNVKISNDKIKETIKSFIGKQEQIPPIYSAIKVNGKKLYEYARKGIEVEIPKRKIEIYSIVIKEINLKENTLVLTVNCSKGTYIRTLCEDIGKKLDTVATMLELRRIKSGNFEIENSVKLEDITKETILFSLEEVFKDKEKIILNEKQKIMFLNGVKLDFKRENGLYRIYNGNDFIGLASCNEGKVKREIIKEGTI